jgi:D-tagatose-1,6-bisphosphate aldolase subunit GatZ/KbaZ
MTLLSQYLPGEYEAVRSGELANRPADLVRHRILSAIDAYAAACGMR